MQSTAKVSNHICFILIEKKGGSNGDIVKIREHVCNFALKSHVIIEESQRKGVRATWPAT